MNKLNSAVYFMFMVAVAVGILIWVAGTDKNSPNNLSGDVTKGIASDLTIDEKFFDFGKISMAAGVVSHEFKIKNEGAENVTISQIYTSCMCTQASYTKGDVKFGPFGMAGHGFVPKLNTKLAPGEEAVIKVDFDPAAHGPAGVGPIDRVVYVFPKDSKPVELKFKALVTP